MGANIEELGGSGYEYVQDTEPSAPEAGETWLDTSSDPPKSKVYADLGGGGAFHQTDAVATVITNLDKAISALNDLAQSDVLSDGTPFDGANIDAAVSSRATPDSSPDPAEYTTARAENLDNLDKAISALNDLSQSDILADGTAFDGANIANLDKAISALNDLAQSDILSDGTPFAGGNIDAAVSTRAEPTDSPNPDEYTDSRAGNLDNLDKAISALNDLAQSDILSDNTAFDGANIDAPVSSAGDKPSGVKQLLHDTEASLPAVFQDATLSAEIAQSIYAMEEYVAEREFIFNSLKQQSTGMAEMAKSPVAIRELYSRTTTRRTLFQNTTASDELVQYDAAMDYLFGSVDDGWTQENRRTWIEEAFKNYDALPDAVTTTELSMDYLKTDEVGMDVAAPLSRMMVDRIRANDVALDAFFETDFRFGRGLRTIDSNLNSGTVDSIETYTNFLNDGTAMNEAANSNTTLDAIIDSFDVGFSQLLGNNSAMIDVLSVADAFTHIYSDQTVENAVDTRTAFHTSSHFDEIWALATSQNFYQEGTPTPPATVSGENISIEFSTVNSPRSGSTGYVLEGVYTSSAADDEFVGWSTPDLDFSEASTIEIYTNVDTADTAKIVIKVNGTREVELRDDNHPVGWNDYQIDVSELNATGAIELGVAMANTSSSATGTLRFGDVSVQ